MIGTAGTPAEEVRAEIVGEVLEVLTGAGATVRGGTPVVVLESMKMEIPVLTEAGGTVRSLAVAAGDVVHDGDLIAVVDPAPVADPRPNPATGSDGQWTGASAARADGRSSPPDAEPATIPSSVSPR